MKIPYFPILVLLLFPVSPLPAEGENRSSTSIKNIIFRQIETSYMINSILEDRDGFIWLGTQSGLVKYNGYDFVEYKAGLFKTYVNNRFNSNSLSENQYIGQISEDSAGFLWIAGYTTGELVRFNPETFEYALYTADDGIHPGLSGPFKPIKTRDGRL